jgi:SulP family sulfate permease
VFLLTVFADLVIAVNVGIILAILQFMRRMTDAVEAKPATGRALRAELAELGIAALPADVMVYDIVGPMFFGAIENFKRPRESCRGTVTVRTARRLPARYNLRVCTRAGLLYSLKYKHGKVQLLSRAGCRLPGCSRILFFAKLKVCYDRAAPRTG